MQRGGGGALNWILKVLTWNILKDGAQRVDGKNSVTCLVAMFTFRVMDFRISEVANFWIFYWWQQNISHSFGNIFKYTWKILSYRSYSQALDCSWDIVCRNTENKCWVFNETLTNGLFSLQYYVIFSFKYRQQNVDLNPSKKSLVFVKIRNRKLHLYVQLSYTWNLYLRKSTHLRKDAACLHFCLKESSENMISPWNRNIRN